MSKEFTVKTAYANIYNEPSFSSEMVTQALFLESLTYLAVEHDDWFKIKQWDEYTGWIHKFYLSIDPKTNQQKFFNVLSEKSCKKIKKIFLTDRFTPIYSSPNTDNLIAIAPFASHIEIQEFSKLEHPTRHLKGWNSLILDYEFCFLKVSNNSNPQDIREKIIAFSNRLLGSPYLWGGKSPFGFDCSGFVQSLYRAVGIEIKRDTGHQIMDSRFLDIDIDSAEPGDLIFFNIDGNGVDHVGIYHGEGQVVHCGGEVKIQSIFDDNDKLKKSIDKVKSLKNLIL